MSGFLDRFLPDPEFSDSRCVWETAKPFFKEAVVQFAPYDPDFHLMKLGKGKPYLLDPSCPHARALDDRVSVVIYERDEQAAPLQQAAWEYIESNPGAVEAGLTQKLSLIHKRCLEQFLEEELPGNPPLEKHWALIQSKIESPEEAIDQFFKLVGVSLVKSGLDETGIVGFEFQSAWDQDHGLEIVMHKDRVLAAAGMTELASPNRPIHEMIKAIQAYELDPSDLAIV